MKYVNLIIWLVPALIGGYADARANDTLSPLPRPIQVDASEIPREHWASVFQLTGSGGFDAPRNEKIELKPIGRQAAIFKDVFLASQLTTGPKGRLRPGPSYPRAMLSHNIPGQVVVACIVDEKGHVKDPKIIEANDESFAKAVLQALERWVFMPGLVGKKPTPCVVVLPFDFAKE